MRHVFLSYRRDDTQYITGFIHQHLTAPTGFGPDSVFMDIDTIPPGVDFREVIDEHVTQCRFFLAVIGKQWATVRAPDGQLRLHNPNDFVRLEIETALRRDIPVVPLLVDGAKMPRADELPECLHPLLFKNATTIRPGKLFAPDVEELVKGLHKAEEWTNRKATMIQTEPAPQIDQETVESRQIRDELAEYERALQKPGATKAFFRRVAVDRFPAWLAAARAGDPNSMALAGLSYSVGVGTSEDSHEAARWFRRAAEVGNRVAMNMVGVCYANGIGVERDEAEAVAWYRRAIELESVQAMRSLARAYEDGCGVPKNRQEAISWYRKSAKIGYQAAKDALKRLGVPEDE